jgi:hypothetical protein
VTEHWEYRTSNWPGSTRGIWCTHLYKEVLRGAVKRAPNFCYRAALLLASHLKQEEKTWLYLDLFDDIGSGV